MGEEDDVMPDWVNLWGLAAVALASLALLLGMLVGLRFLTVGFAALGLVVVVLGIRATGEERKTKDKVWLALGGVLSGTILFLTLMVPGVLNNWWALDTAVPQADPDAKVVVPREQALAEGKPLAAGETADAATEAIRQDDVFLRVEAVKVGPVPGQGGPACLLVYLRLANCKKERLITVENFVNGTHSPKLTDDKGHEYKFLGQRRRRQARGDPVFEISGPSPVELLPAGELGNDKASWQDYLLIFSSPPSKLGTLILEVPASAWDRNGVCKFRISELF